MNNTGHLSLKARNRVVQYENKKHKKFRTEMRILRQNSRSLNPVLNSIEYIEFNMGVKITKKTPFDALAVKQLKIVFYHL